MKKKLLWSAAVLFLSSCQYPVDPTSLPDNQKFLVIDAELTEHHGKVNVTYTLEGVTPQGGYLFPDPPQATAYVLDSKGNRTDFFTDGSLNDNFKGVVGETYKLYITADGQTYESTAETMRACPELDSLTPLYVRESFRDPNDLYYDGFDVYAQFTDVAGQESYYQWDWVHYKRVFSCAIWQEGGQEVQVPCTPFDCWGIEYNTRVIVQSDKLRDGQPIAQRVVRVPYAKPPEKYYLRVEQRSITPAVYEYLKSLETQTQNSGSLFDVPAQTRFSPNVHNVNNPSEKILGVFSVFSSRYKIIFIDMKQEIPSAIAKNVANPRPFTSVPLAQAPCTETKYRTQTRPEGWED
jgi:hypothetical protein